MTPEQLVTKYQAVQVQSSGTVLADIDTINWSALQHAHGAASDIPALLRGALSEDEDDRKFAFILLHETIWHQGTVYEASAYVVPFLFKMLQSPETPDKPSVALLLTSLADGNSYLEVHAFYNKEREKTWSSILAQEGRDLETEMAKELSWVSSTREAVGKGLALLYGYLNHQESEIRGAIAGVLAHYPEHAIDSLQVLEAALASEQDLDVKAEIGSTITALKEIGS